MRLNRWTSAVLGLAILFTTHMAAQEDKGDEGKRPRGQARFRAIPLLQQRLLDSLELTEEQQTKVAALEKEFANEQKASREQLTELLKKGREGLSDEERTKVRDLQREVAGLRSKYQAKVTALLTEEQKKKAGNRLLPLQRFAVGRQLTIERAQRQLDLTKEQREKLKKLRKEFEEKQLEVLTEEQKKKFEELKKGNGRPRGIRPAVAPVRPIQLKKIQPGKVQPKKIQIKPIQAKQLK